MSRLLACSLRVGIGALVAVAVFLGPATAASAEVITTEQPIVLETGETVLEV